MPPECSTESLFCADKKKRKTNKQTTREKTTMVRTIGASSFEIDSKHLMIGQDLLAEHAQVGDEGLHLCLYL